MLLPHFTLQMRVHGKSPTPQVNSHLVKNVPQQSSYSLAYVCVIIVLCVQTLTYESILTSYRFYWHYKSQLFSYFHIFRNNLVSRNVLCGCFGKILLSFTYILITCKNLWNEEITAPRQWLLTMMFSFTDN